MKFVNLKFIEQYGLRVIVLIIIAGIFVSCSQSENCFYEFKHVRKGNSLKTEINPNLSGDFVNKKDNQTYYFVADAVIKKELAIFNFNTGQLVDKFSIKKACAIISNQIESIEMINMDTILFLGKGNPNVLVFSNNQDSVWKQVDLNKFANKGKVYYRFINPKFYDGKIIFGTDFYLNDLGKSQNLAAEEVLDLQRETYKCAIYDIQNDTMTFILPRYIKEIFPQGTFGASMLNFVVIKNKLFVTSEYDDSFGICELDAANSFRRFKIEVPGLVIGKPKTKIEDISKSQEMPLYRGFSYVNSIIYMDELDAIAVQVFALNSSMDRMKSVYPCYNLSGKYLGLLCYDGHSFMDGGIYNIGNYYAYSSKLFLDMDEPYYFIQ